jgi:hypothetical protein
MRFKTIIESVILLALSVAAQTSDSNDVIDSSELLAELTQLPECAVSSYCSATNATHQREPIKLTSSDLDDLHSDRSPSLAMRPHRFRLPVHRRRIYFLQRAMHSSKLHDPRSFV